ncbi:hypothetical protein TIFTF001_048915 [Ficus carica]|uniref:Uncharacterized protein n=1 Tax=Ficus carica TaxID=3494 RepID=A0AA87Z0P5_FICCA|nr:hypothetical protein TIFTF001_048915 [Ficus carica]
MRKSVVVEKNDNHGDIQRKHPGEVGDNNNVAEEDEAAMIVLTVVALIVVVGLTKFYIADHPCDIKGERERKENDFIVCYNSDGYGQGQGRVVDLVQHRLDPYCDINWPTPTLIWHTARPQSQPLS